MRQKRAFCEVVPPTQIWQRSSTAAKDLGLCAWRIDDMRVKGGILKSIIICLGVAGVVAQGHAANMCIDSKKLTIQFDACLKRAAAAMAKHYRRTETTDDTVFGFRGEYVAGILCNATDKGVVFIASSGPDANVCRRSMESLIKDF